jgi:hypothetical protein
MKCTVAKEIQSYERVCGRYLFVCFGVSQQGDHNILVGIVSFSLTLLKKQNQGASRTNAVRSSSDEYDGKNLSYHANIITFKHIQLELEDTAYHSYQVHLSYNMGGANIHASINILLHSCKVVLLGSLVPSSSSL